MCSDVQAETGAERPEKSEMFEGKSPEEDATTVTLYRLYTGFVLTVGCLLEQKISRHRELRNTALRLLEKLSVHNQHPPVATGEKQARMTEKEEGRASVSIDLQKFPSNLQDWSEVEFQIDETSVMGQGTESSVYRAMLQNGTYVAIKKPKIRGYECLQRFKTECAILAALAPHPRIACLIGADPSPQRRALVLPLALGDLATLIHERGVHLGRDLSLVYALQCAEALEHVHKMGFIHRDVKSSNLLVSHDWQTVLLSDFGLAQVQSHLTEEEARAAVIAGNRRPTGGIYRVRMVGTLVSLAPEVLQNRPHTKESDMYSWSIMVNELLSCTVPYSDRLMANPKPHTILDQTFNQKDLMEPRQLCLAFALSWTAPSAPEWFVELVQRTWVRDVLSRPAAGSVVGEMREKGVQAHVTLGSEPEDLGDLASGGKAQCIDKKDASEDDVRRGEQVVGSWQPAAVCGVGEFVTAGRRGWDMMEDFVVMERLGSGVVLFGVMDGHGGKVVSQYIAANLKRAFLVVAGEMGTQVTPGSILSAVLVRLEQEVLCLDGVTAGSTALVGCLTGSHVWIANVGDCRAVCENQGGIVKRLTRDHTCCDSTEAARVVALGGYVDGGRINGRIEVSRTIGDKALKPPLSAEPEVFCHDVSSMRYLVAASDGLWEVISDEAAMGYVRDTVKVAKLGAQRLGMEAIDPGGSKDNISVVLIIFGDLHGAVEQTFAGPRN